MMSPDNGESEKIDTLNEVRKSELLIEDFVLFLIVVTRLKKVILIHFHSGAFFVKIISGFHQIFSVIYLGQSLMLHINERI